MAGSAGDIIGAVCIGVGMVLAVSALVAWREQQALREAAKTPRRMLSVVTDGPGEGARRAVGVSGTVVSPAGLRGPLTDEPCVAWHLGLWRDDSAPDSPGWSDVWSTDRVQDLEIAYDLRFTHDGRRPPPDPPQLVPHPGTVAIPGARTGFAHNPLTAGTDAEVDAALLPLLEASGVPEELRQDSRVHRYRLREERLATGALVQCFQSAPEARFELVEVNLEALRGQMAGCLVRMLLAGSLVALAVGVVLIAGGSPGGT
jgi:hypothetical protein